VTVAKGYRLLRAVLNTAVRDKRIKENPCEIEGADKESSPERPVLSVAEVFRLADAIAPRYRALVLLATFGNMRWGELAGLRRRNLDLDAQSVRIDETVYELGPLVKGTPKSEAGKRKIAIPELIIPDLRHTWRTSPLTARMVRLRRRQGGQLRRSNFSKPWARARDAADLPRGVHVHDLRHTCNTFAAETGASLAELMSRMGHSSIRGGADLPPRPAGAGQGDRHDAGPDGQAGAEALAEKARRPIGHVTGTKRNEPRNERSPSA
jgi:integrase